MSPNDPKLSDRRSGRGTCRWVERWGWSAAGAVTSEPVRCSAWFGDVGFIVSLKLSPKLFVSAEGEVQAGNRPVKAFEVVSALLGEVINVPMLIGLADEGRNVVQVLGLDGAILEVSEDCGITNPQETVMKYLDVDGIAFSHCVRESPNDPSSATRPAGRNDCNRDAHAGFAAAHGYS